MLKNMRAVVTLQAIVNDALDGPQVTGLGCDAVLMNSLPVEAFTFVVEGSDYETTSQGI